VQRNVPDAQYWLDRAEQARLQAEAMTDLSAKCQMLQIAAGYRSLVKHAGARSEGQKSRT